jgi:thioredoxin reductase (NADPH)
MMRVDVAIIGSGPAGMMTALQLKRYGMDTLLLETCRVGGLLVNANLVENYPGFPEGIPGPKLVDLFERQVRTAGVSVVYETVTSLDYEGSYFHIQSSRNSYQSRFAVIASGTKAVPFPPGTISEGATDRVSYEVNSICGVENCRIAIVGAGDAAFDYALNLERSNHVQILNRSHSVKCLPLLWDRFLGSGRIQYQSDIEVVSVFSRTDGGLHLICNSPEGVRSIEADYLVGALGRVPQMDFISSRLYDKIQELENQGNLYLVGDVKNGRYRQTAIAVGDGLMAAMKIYHLMEAL